MATTNDSLSCGTSSSLPREYFYGENRPSFLNYGTFVGFIILFQLDGDASLVGLPRESHRLLPFPSHVVYSALILT